MKSFYQMIALCCCALLFTGCSSLAKMQPTTLIETPSNGTALISFVRPRIFMGDGVNFEVWDGTNFVGTFSAGTMVQHIVQPGEHIFMIDPTQGGKWAFIKLDVEANKTYFIKPNTVPFVGLRLDIASANDERIPEWKSNLKPMAIDSAKSKPLPQKSIDKATHNLTNFKLM